MRILFFSFSCLAVFLTAPVYAIEIKTSSGEKTRVTLQSPYAYENFYSGTFIGLRGGFATTAFSGNGTNTFTYAVQDASNRTFSAGTSVQGNISSLFPSPKGGTFGGYAGYGVQTKFGFYASAEANFYFLNPSSTGHTEASNFKTGERANYLLADGGVEEAREIFIGGRTGFVLRKRFLVYVKAGYRLAAFSLSGTFKGETLDRSGNKAGFPETHLTTTIQLSGPSVGWGFEFPIPIRYGSVKFTLRNEFMYTNYLTYVVDAKSKDAQTSSQVKASIRGNGAVFSVGLDVLF